MNVLVIGANGKIGKQLVEKLADDSGYTPKAMVRKEEQLQQFEDMGADTVLADVEGAVDDLAAAAKGMDAIVFTAGSGAQTGADKTMMVDFDGAVKSMQAAEQAGVKRFLIVSAIGVHRREKWMEKAPYYSAAKHYADEWLVASNLDYTILRPGLLTNDAGKENIKVDVDLERAEIPREDVANTIKASLKDNGTIGKAFDLTTGESPIELALQNL
ncbi:SDR family oxidoreductase [Salicibibacter kimchii]|uniref:SDR family NAD(P)-dependent oxidoreductase n=1 Tax=Salicibibacter kimchii TaxID=2099786 RepID=A0A345BXT0_9BACI|nr:SDR family oxidoreductase [Salicibibacter kimchii]AXF55761.1 SDR family NAD(P)-dependent oxidoreductase [Salicibibacter kimchii]